MKVILSFTAVLLVQLLLLKESLAVTCPDFTNLTAQNISLPTLPRNYQTEIEVNVVDKGYTLQTSVYRDFDGNRAAVKVFSQGSDSKYIYSYNTDEIFKISGSSCSVEQLSTSSDNFLRWLLGVLPTDRGVHLPDTYTPRQMPNANNFALAYIGNDTKRGIPVDHWQYCFNMDPYTTVIHYYFAHTDTWNTASNFTRVPVRTEILADKRLPDGSVYSVHHVYDYFNFLPVIDAEPTIFETSSGVFCPGRKTTKTLPKLPKRFYCRTEIIYPSPAVVTYVDEWYDGAFKVYRRDYKPSTPEYPTVTLDPVTEIHDYYIGARYVIDKTVGNCTVLPLSNSSSDTVQNVTAQQINGTYILNLKNPLQMFNLDWNYTYVGQTYERGVLCDVFVTMRKNFIVNGVSLTANTTITFYFLAQGWAVYDSDVKQMEGYATPVKMMMQAEEIGLSVTYNYVDFSIVPMLENYDVSVCYPEANKIKLQVRFTGTMPNYFSSYIEDAAHMMFAQELGVSWLRIQHLAMDVDDAYIYISFTLLDRTPPTAQFEYIPGKVIEKQDDDIIYNVTFPMECAAFCINEQRFLCNSFDFCSNECRLSRAHIGDGSTVVVDSTTCDHFSRSVKGVRDEPSVLEAFEQLRMKVYNHTLRYSQTFIANDVTVKFGWITPKVIPRKLGNYLHYRIEASVPALKYIYEGEVWYDKTFQLVRYDVHYNRPIEPYPTTNPMTIIDDFSTGLQYVIDRVYKNCTIQAIPVEDFAATFTQQDQGNSTWSLRIKTPEELLHIDDSYKFVGQQTVRGMLCNVFESLRTDYKVPSLEGTYKALFRYSFLATDWAALSEEYAYDDAVGEPVKLEITVLKFNLFLEYNLFDYSNARPDISTYDIHQCFDTPERKTFQIAFPGPFHPYLDTETNMFQVEAVFAMARLTRLPPLRYQRTRLDYDRDNIYITSTVVGQPQVPTYFTHIINGSVVEHATSIAGDVFTAKSCAQSCYTNTDFVCNSFYFCSGSSQCLMSKQNVPNEPKTNIVPGCDAYSRTITARDFPPPTGINALTMLENNVYGGQLQITIPGPGTLEPHMYTATMMRSDIVDPAAYSKDSVAMKEFTIIGNNSKLKDFDTELNNLSVDDCALACDSTIDYQCEGFYYCGDSFQCGLVKTRLDAPLPSNATVQSDFCYIYQRTYLADYILTMGLVSMASPDIIVTDINSTNDCARTCSMMSSFQCKAAQFCGVNSMCLLFKERSLGKYGSHGNNPCYYLKRNYINDFMPINSGTYKFSSVLTFISVSVTACAQFCIEQQGDACQGFYFCDQTMRCYLTSIQSGAGQQQVQNDTSDGAAFCNYYNRIGSISSSSSPLPLSTSSSGPVTVKTTSPVTHSVVTHSVVTHSGVTQSGVTQSTSQKTISHSSSTQTSPCVGVSPTPLGQKDNNSSNKNTGTIIGVAFGTFILGLIVGAAVLFLFSKYRLKSKDEFEMLTKNEM